MPKVRSTSENPVQIYDDLSFVTKQDVSAGDQYTPAYIIEGSENRVLGIESNTPLAPEFRDSSGEKLDESTRIVLQKADPEGNPLGNAIVFESNMDVFNYVKFRSDEDYFKTTSKGIVIDEREFLHIYLQIPSGANGFDAGKSRLTIGDTATRTGKPVFIREKNSLNAQQQAAVEQASTQS